jgi:hypothetical protein
MVISPNLRACLRHPWLVATWLGFWLGLIPPNLCRGEEVILQLRNGDRLTGNIISESTNKVTLDAVSLGKVQIPVAQIKSRKRIASKHSPKAAEQTALQNPPVAPAKKPDTVAAKESQTPAVKKPAESPKERSSVAPGPKPKPVQPKRKLWKFDLQLGANLQYNQKNTELYTGDFKADYGDPKTRFRNTFDYHVRDGRLDDQVSANNMNGLIRTEFDLAKKYFVFNAAGAGYDEIRKIDLTYEESFGVGYTLVKMTNFVLSVDFGANYQEQFFSDGTAKEYFSPRLGEKSSWKLSSKFEVTQAFEFYPRSANLEDYRVRSEAVLRYLLSTFLTLNLRVADIYDTRPAPGVTPNDLQINSTIGVHF